MLHQFEERQMVNLAICKLFYQVLVLANKPQDFLIVI